MYPEYPAWLDPAPRAVHARAGFPVISMSSRILHRICVAALLPLTLVTLFAAPRTWTNTNGQTMEAELIGLADGQITFRKADGQTYRYAFDKLDADSQVAALAAQEELAKQPPSQPAEEQKSAPPPPPATGKLALELVGKLITADGKTISRDALAPKRYIALYYSASWCPPCRKFTPELVKAYAELGKSHPEFEIVLVGSDKDESKMRDYLKDHGMPWPGLKYSAMNSVRAVREGKEKGIPNLVLVGPEGDILVRSYQSGEYRGPSAALNDIRKLLKKVGS